MSTAAAPQLARPKRPSSAATRWRSSVKGTGQSFNAPDRSHFTDSHLRGFTSPKWTPWRRVLMLLPPPFLSPPLLPLPSSPPPLSLRISTMWGMKMRPMTMRTTVMRIMLRIRVVTIQGGISIESIIGMGCESRSLGIPILPLPLDLGFDR
uniref:Uncharacterized protein n=1 Tax=Opuntia streptacantha TaxID=393608 RepID=A0A7C9DY23_OPUST